ncbi:MAG TPA: hypothetical protein DEO86_05275 [Colwellia sp.]|nr:hypothetical protein [Colwellia sp.]
MQKRRPLNEIMGNKGKKLTMRSVYTRPIKSQYDDFKLNNPSKSKLIIYVGKFCIKKDLNN